MVRPTSAAVMLLLAACSLIELPRIDQPAVVPSAAAGGSWIEPAAYSFTLESRCGERSLIGRFRIGVANGAVVSVEGLDGQGERAASVLQPADFPTLAGLLALTARARRDGADRVQLVTDPGDGHPVSIAIDWDVAAVDDEECYVVSGLEAG